MLYSSFKFYWVIIEFFSGLIASGLSIVGIYSLLKNRNNKAPLFFWGLQMKNSTKSFSLLVLAAIMFLFTFILYLLATVYSNTNLMLAAFVLGTITYALVVVVVFWWVKYFARFV